MRDDTIFHKFDVMLSHKLWRRFSKSNCQAGKIDDDSTTVGKGERIFVA